MNDETQTALFYEKELSEKEKQQKYLELKADQAWSDTYGIDPALEVMNEGSKR